MAARSATATFEVTEVRTAQPRAQTEPSQQLVARRPPSAAPESTTRPVKKLRPQVQACCGHIHRGDAGIAVGMKPYHPRNKGCLLKHADPKFRGKVMSNGYARNYKLDPAINHTAEDPTKFHLHWLTSKNGCQYCQLGVAHPDEFPDPKELLQLQEAAAILQSVASDAECA